VELRVWHKTLAVIILCALGIVTTFFKEGYGSILIFSVLINGVLAVSYDVPGRSLGLISLGHATFFGLGAYCFGISITNGLTFFPALIFSVILSLVGAAMIAIPLARLNHGYYALATLGVLFIFQRLAESLEKLTGGPAGLYIPATLSRYHCGLLALLVLLMTAFGYELYAGSRWGIYSRETEADEEAAQAIGIPTYKVKIVGLIAAALPASLAGALYLARTSYVSPDSGFSLTLSITALLASRIVPIKGVLGPLLGALLITAIEEIIWTRFTGFNQALFGLLLLTAALYHGRVANETN